MGNRERKRAQRTFQINKISTKITVQLKKNHKISRKILLLCVEKKGGAKFRIYQNMNS